MNKREAGQSFFERIRGRGADHSYNVHYPEFKASIELDDNLKPLFRLVEDTTKTATHIENSIRYETGPNSTRYFILTTDSPEIQGKFQIISCNLIENESTR